MQDSTAIELKHRIEADKKFYNDYLPERVAIAWRGYLAGLLEWSVISVSVHDQLIQALPKIDNDPVVDILLGRE